MRKKRIVGLVVGALVLAVGLGCLNYTQPEGLEHHRSWAQEKGLPEPGTTIWRSGVAAAVIGAGLLGFTLGRPRMKL